MPGLVTATHGGDDARRATVIRLAGEFDAFNIRQLREAAAASLRDGEARLVLDLRPVAFLDSAMLHALLEVSEEARRAGGAVVLVRPAPRAWRTFEVTGLDRRFESAATLDEALAAVS